MNQVQCKMNGNNKKKNANKTLMVACESENIHIKMPRVAIMHDFVSAAHSYIHLVCAPLYIFLLYFFFWDGHLKIQRERKNRNDRFCEYLLWFSRHLYIYLPSKFKNIFETKQRKTKKKIFFILKVHCIR